MFGCRHLEQDPLIHPTSLFQLQEHGIQSTCVDARTQDSCVLGHNYDQLGDHNGKPLYQRVVNGSIAMIYFAEVEQGPQGWRCGPDYTEFWVYCPADSPTTSSNGCFAKGGFNFKSVLAVSLGGLSVGGGGRSLPVKNMFFVATVSGIYIYIHACMPTGCWICNLFN